MLLYDPPSGWKYGFPKPYKPKIDKDGQIEELAVTLRRDGYPQAEIDNGGDTYVRFLGSREELIATGRFAIPQEDTDDSQTR